MKKRILFLGLPAAMLLVAVAQQKPDEQLPEEVIRINVNLVQMDAVVTDQQGKLVTGLKASDFEVRQDNKPQSITHFSYVDLTPRAAGGPAPAPKGAKKKAGDPTAPPPVPLRPEQIRRVYALVVDDLGLAAESIPQVRKALEKFVDEEMQPGDMVAVIRTGAGMSAFQQFTTDKRLLHAAINQVKYNGMSRVGVTSFAPVGQMGGRSPIDAERRSIENAGSMSAITTLINGLRDVPGRKIMLLFTEDLRIMAGLQVDPRAQDAMQQLTDAATRASVVISSIDPRGLQTYQLTAADSPQSPRQAANIPMQRSSQAFFSQDGMVRLADATGGIFLHDNNDIVAQMRRVVAQSAGYYLIAYHPAAETFDQKTGRPLFHRVSIRVKRPGLTVHVRRGFLGHPDAPVRTVARTPQQDLIHAMVSPFATGRIHVQLTALFSNSEKEGSYVNALLHIDANDLQFNNDLPDNMHQATIDVLSATFDEKGKVQEPVEKIYKVNLTDVLYKHAMKSGFLYTFQHLVKKPGGYQMRVALRDSNSLQIGAASQYVEVPDLSKNHLELSSLSLSDQTGMLGQNGPDGKPTQVHENPLGGPAVRSFLPGTEVMYALQVLNARLDSAGKPQLEVVTRMFKDGVQMFESKPRPIQAVQQTDPKHVLTAGELRIGKIPPGDYVLQVIITDKISDKNNVASQSIDFTIRE